MMVWHPFDQITPQVGVQVLAYFHDGENGCMQIASIEEGDRRKHFWMSADGEALPVPTHWMELPEAPSL